MDKHIFILPTHEESQSLAQLQKDIQNIKNAPYVTACFDSVTVPVVILTVTWQVVYANSALLKQVGDKPIDEIYGLKPGRIIDCESSGGECGNTDACRMCKLMNVFYQSKSSGIPTQSSMSVPHASPAKTVNQELDLNITPIHIEKTPYFILVLSDKADAIRRREMERVFFHDITNTIGALSNYTKLLKREENFEFSEEVDFYEKVIGDLLDNIIYQKYLTDAEHNELVVQTSDFESLDLLRAVARLTSGLKVSEKQLVEIDDRSVSVPLCSDQFLIKRILINMIKNALEQEQVPPIVSVGSYLIEEPAGKMIEFRVVNHGVIPLGVRESIFTRTFSTKGQGRGLGTYSMKLFGERYLHGQVGFRCVFNAEKNHEETMFYLRLPLSFNEDSDKYASSSHRR